MKQTFGNIDKLELAFELPPENEEDNIEYKWKFEDLSDTKIAKRIGQMSRRLRRGSGHCIYQLGVMDKGEPVGLNIEEMTQTLKILAYFACQNGAKFKELIPRRAHGGQITFECHLISDNQDQKHFDPWSDCHLWEELHCF